MEVFLLSEYDSVQLQILILVALTLINAFFSCAEMAIVSVNKNKIKILAESTGNKNLIMIDNLLKDPTKFLSTIQVAITLAGFLASASAATSFSDDLAKYLGELSVPYPEAVSLSIVTVILSYFTLIFGELVPKRIALHNPEKIAEKSVAIIAFSSKIMAPFVWFLTFSTNVVVSILGFKKEENSEMVSEEEIKIMVELGKVSGTVNDEEHKMIHSIFEFNDKKVEEIMVPRIDVFALDVEKPLSEYWDSIFMTKYSRIPVYRGNTDNIIGILYLKDLIQEAKNKGFEHVELESIIHNPFFISKNMNIDLVLKELKKLKKYMAIIIDEYGGFSGIITVEDIVEEIVGDIEDEYDDEMNIEKLSETEYRINGMYSLTDLKNYFGIAITSEKINTISGYITEKLRKIPDDSFCGFEIKGENYSLTVEKVKDNRVLSVILKKKDKDVV